MDRLEVSDQLWEPIKPLLPQRQRRQRWPGRLPLDDRACLNGILFVLSTRPGSAGTGSRSSWAMARA
jgi:transposase